MKTLTLLQAGALLMLAVIGAYAGHSSADTTCAAQTKPAEACDL